MARTYEPISTQTLGSNQSIITFTSIPQTYTDLVIVAVGESTSGGSMRTKLNSDSGSNYSNNWFYGTGSGTGFGQNSNDSTGLFLMRTTTNLLGGGIAHINNYSNTTTYKSSITRNFGSDPIVWFAAGLWRSTSAVTRIDMDDESSGQFKTGFTVTLYGVKAA